MPEYPQAVPEKEIRVLQSYLRGEGDKYSALIAAWAVEGYFLGRYLNEYSPVCAVGDESPVQPLAMLHASVKKVSRDSLLQFFQHSLDTADPANLEVGASFGRSNKGYNLMAMVVAAMRIKSLILGDPGHSPWKEDGA
jgi:hypothetical protein